MMSDRRERLVIGGNQCEETAVDTGVLQGSPVSPMHFAINLSVVFKEVEKEVEGYVATSFANDWRWPVEVYSVEQLCKQLTTD